MRSSLVRSLVAVALAAPVGGCGSDGGSGGITNPPGESPVATVSVSAPTEALVPGQTAQLAATIRDASGAELSGRTISWSSSDDAVG